MYRVTRPRPHLTLLFGFTIFLSAFLLFSIQPMFAKLILPWFGGSAAVWTTCLVFFQTALLAGYAYSWLVSTRLRPRDQAILHVAFLALAILFLPVEPASHWRPAPDSLAHPAARILAMLAVVLGLPYFLLSTTGPLLQSWFARAAAQESSAPHSAGASPYRLFALSNAGALIALIAYPLWIEPRLPTHLQDRLWSIAFVVFAALCAVAAYVGQAFPPADENNVGQAFPPADENHVGQAFPPAAENHVGQAFPPAGENNVGQAFPPADEIPTTPPSRTQRMEWIALAAAGSMLLLATTNQLTQNVAPVPLLWVIPLAIYLLTFILAFESPRWYRRDLLLRFLAVALASVAYAIYDIQLSDAIAVSLPLFCGALFIGCMFCHGELNGLKPPSTHLTSFYLMIALGGALGAVFVGLIAPLIFSGTYELPVAMLVIAALALWMNRDRGWSQRLLWSAVTAAMVVAAVTQVRAYHRNAVELERSFYGSLRVVDSGGVRTLYHGTVEHGSEFLDPTRNMTPTTYYGPSSGIGIALRSLPDVPKHVGVIGLGAGTLASYGRPGDEFHFYEINPQVAEIARRQFHYLDGSAAKIDITLGDARLSLEAGSVSPAFDVLIVDAFSGDAIPVHLLTKEAFALYLQRLKPSGILAIHVSNQYLDLAPVVGQLASLYDLSAIEIRSPKDASRQTLEAFWILMTRNRDVFSLPEIASPGAGSQRIPIPSRPDLRLWTDDYNNLLQVMRWIPGQ
jgi:hypothetical protein